MKITIDLETGSHETIEKLFRLIGALSEQKAPIAPDTETPENKFKDVILAPRGGVDEILRFVNENAGIKGLTSAEIKEGCKEIAKGKNRWWVSQSLYYLASKKKVDRIFEKRGSKFGVQYRYFKKGTLKGLVEKAEKEESTTKKHNGREYGAGKKEIVHVCKALLEDKPHGVTASEIMLLCDPKIMEKYSPHYVHQVLRVLEHEGKVSVKRTPNRGMLRTPNVYYKRADW